MAADPTVWPGTDKTSAVYKGVDLKTAKLDQPTTVERYVPGEGWFVTTEYITDKDRWENDKPESYSKHPVRIFSLFRGATARQFRGTNLVKVTLRWEPDPEDSGETGEFCPPAEYSENGALGQESIKLHPKFASDFSQFYNKQTDDFQNETGPSDQWLVGVKFYQRATFTVTETQYFSSKPSSIRNELNKLIDPPGHPSQGNKRQWKVQTGGVNTAGECWAKFWVYEFNEAGWNPRIYDGSV